MENKDKELIRTANIQRAFVMTVAKALHFMIADMIEYCKKNSIVISNWEKQQLNYLNKTINILTSDYSSLGKDKFEAFKIYSRIMAVTIQELFSKTDSDYMTMFKFYNYVKAFPTTCKEIEVPSNKEAEAFSVVFGNSGDNNG